MFFLAGKLNSRLAHVRYTPRFNHVTGKLILEDSLLRCLTVRGCHGPNQPLMSYDLSCSAGKWGLYIDAFL